MWQMTSHTGYTLIGRLSVQPVKSESGRRKSSKIYDLIYDIRQCLSTHQLESYIFAHVTLQYIGKTNRPVKNIFGCWTFNTFTSVFEAFVFVHLFFLLTFFVG